MNNIRIGTRLNIAFGFMVILVISIYLIGVTKCNSLGKSAEQISGRLYTDASAATKLRYYTSDMSRLVRNLIILTDPQAKLKTVENYNRERREVDRLIAVLDHGILSTKGRDIFTRLKSNAAIFLPFISEVVELAQQNKKEEAAQLLFGPRHETQEKYMATLEELETFEEKLISDFDAQAQKDRDDAIRLMSAATAIAVLLAALATWLITRSITQPIKKALAAAQRVALGDLGGHIQTSDRDETGKLLSAIGDMQASLVRTVSLVRDNAESVASASIQITQGNIDLSERTEEQASALEQTASTMAQLSMTVQNNADNARQAALLADNVRQVANKGYEATQAIAETMKTISESSRFIADITSVIDSIAFQTNILALNAAVEAARAGQHGKGFAAVASEVQILAQRSSTAAGEIRQLIEANGDGVISGNELVSHASKTMHEIVSAIGQLTDAVEEITAASTEQAHGIEQIGIAVTEMDSTTQQNAALVEESAMAAAGLQDQASQLLLAVSVFNLQESGDRHRVMESYQSVSR